MHFKNYKINIIFFIFSFVLVASFVLFDILFFSNKNKNVALDHTLDVAKQKEASVNAFLDHSATLLHSIRKSKSFTDYLDAKNDTAQTEELFLTLLNIHSNIKELRFIDTKGDERIRAQRVQNKTATLVAKDKLENRLNSYCFRNSMKRALNEVCYSNLELQTNNGVVQTPYIPVLRATLPIEKDGLFYGVIAVEYFMQDVLDECFKNSSYEMILLNSKGDILKHYDSQKDWGSYKKQSYSLKDEYPKEAPSILSQNIFKTDRFASVKFDTVLQNDLILILQLKEAHLSNVLKIHIYQTIGLGFLVILIALILNIMINKILKNITTDLDESKKLNTKLQALSNSLNEAQKVAKIGFWKFDSQTEELSWSRGVYAIFGIEKSSIKSTYEMFLSFVHKNDRERLNKEYLDSIEQKREYYIVHKIITQAGEMRYVQERATHYYDENNKHLYSIGSIYDKTDTIIAQTKVQKYVEIINNNIITSSTDLQGIITSVSEAFCNISGYTKEELIGKNHNIVRHPDMDSKIFKRMWNAISNDVVWKGEMKNLKKSGDFYWVGATIYPLYNDIGDKTGYTAVRQDITSKKLLEEIAITDALTDISNRRHFNDMFPKILNSSKRTNELLAFLIMDIDCFKQYNDTYGHQMGDEALKRVALAIASTLNRSDDFCFRLGGEEFGAIFKAKTKAEALLFAHKIKDAIDALKIVHEKNSVSAYVSVSIGLVCKNAGDIKDDDTIYKEADDLLYKAKDSGKNQIVSNIVS